MGSHQVKAINNAAIENRVWGNRYEMMPCKTFPLFAVLVIAAIGLSPAAFTQETRDRDADVANTMEPPQSRYFPPSQPLPSQFRLGVQIQNTSTGVVITRVLPGSVAQQIGLEAGDVIVTVSGYQVGVVEGRVYDIGDELARRMASQGAASLLVLNHRDGKMVNIPVPSEPSPSATILGTVMTNDRKSVFPSMSLEVRMIDITHPQWKDVTIAETQAPVSGQWPLGFRIDFDPAAVRPNHRYALEAQISYRGQPIQKTLSPVPVNLGTASPRVALTVASFSQTPTNPFPGIGGTSPIDQVDQWYVDLLGRKMTERESAVWQRELSRGKPSTDILATILGSSEYSDRFRGDQRAYVSAVFQYLYRRSPSLTELARWQLRLVQLRDVRLTLAQEMLRESMKR